VSNGGTISEKLIGKNVDWKCRISLWLEN
jgi:hypothetical protein